MLNNTRAIHTINIDQSQRARLLFDLAVGQAEIIAEVLTQEGEVEARQDLGQLVAVGDAALRVERVVLRIVELHVVVERFGHVDFAVEDLDEFAEYGGLLARSCGARRAVGLIGADGVVARVVPGFGDGVGGDGSGEEVGEGGESCGEED